MKKIARIRLNIFVAAAFVLLAGFWLDSYLQAQRTQSELDGMYRRSLGDLMDYVSDMDETLRKAQYTGSALTQVEVTSKLLEQSQGAKAAMAALPFSQEKTERISRFLSQVGDYALAMGRSSISGKNPSKEEEKNIAVLIEYAQQLSDALGQAQARLTVEQGDIAQTVSLLNNLDEVDNLGILDGDIDQAAQKFAEFPALLYDGPFSDHIAGKVSAFLNNFEGLDEAQAKGKAAVFLGVNEDELTYIGEGGNRLVVYQFSTADSIVSITKQGGKLAYYKKTGIINGTKMGYQDALQSAKERLEEWGFLDMKESYYVINDNMCTINFHSQSTTSTGRKVLCYPDLVKMSVELEKGGTVEMDSTGYLMNHQERNLKGPKVAEEEAKEQVNPLLAVESANLAVIPTPGLNEILCWELHCIASNAQEVVSYINTETGQEEQLYLLQKDEHGVLVN